MEYSEPCTKPEETDAVIVKADEVDEAGADISTIVPTDSSGTDFNDRIESRRAQDAQVGGSPKILANAVPSTPKWWARPALRRDDSAVPPPQQPPPPAPPQQREESSNATDSLSLIQLKRLVTDLPKLEPAAYAFEYEDTRPFPEELEEWFQYIEEDRYTLLRAKQTFEEKWGQGQAARVATSDDALGWTKVKQEDRERFVEGAVQALTSSDTATRVKSLECISYIALGTWVETAGLDEESGDPESNGGMAQSLDPQFSKSKLQLNWICSGAKMLCKTAAVPALVNILKSVCESDQQVTPLPPSSIQEAC